MRNRIKEHRKVRAGDLIPHELNFRTHPTRQKKMLAAILGEVGFARSLLAYELPDGRLKLIDGHLRRDMDPEAIVDVEVLDVDDEEARKLLLSVDPLASLAETDKANHARLIDITNTDSDALAELWSLAEQDEPVPEPETITPTEAKPHSGELMILVKCSDERHQVELLKKFRREGIECKPLIS